MTEVVEPFNHSCPNCGHAIDDPLPNYCSHCGQETTLKPPTVLEFAQQFGGSIIATEGALWRTMKLLLFRPGQLTLEYLNGRRRRYVLPLRLFITLSVVALLLMRILANLGGPTLAEIEAGIIVDRPEQNEGSIGIGNKSIAIKNNKVTCTGLPESWCARIKERFVLEPAAIAKRLQDVPGNVLSYAGSAMFLLLPLFAALLKIVYFSRHMRWTEHLIFALHLHAFWFAMLIIQVTGVPAILAIPIYSLMAARAVYGGSRWATFWRWTGLGVVYGVIMGLTLLGLILWAFMFA
ncbi:MAG: DUF3667 domain-containing protein [Rhodocyclaceae bacterium]|nr:DUF3667 domain-containing protein [Rhodocyclaceae bacterium]